MDPERLPSARAAWRRLVDARQAAYEQPWSHAVLRALELEDYRALPQHRVGWIAARLAIPLETEQAGLAVLERTRQVQWSGTHFEPTSITLVDTRAEPERARQLRASWALEGVRRLQAAQHARSAWRTLGAQRRCRRMYHPPG